MRESILAGIVTFNPDISRLKENLESIYHQVDSLVVVDNGSENVKQISEVLRNLERSYLIKLNDNVGIARALNEIGDFAVKNSYDYFLTLDQDSVVMKGLIDEYKKYFLLPELGILNCQRQDRNKQLILEKKELLEKDFVITSGSLMPTELFDSEVRYDEFLFIDDVDFDMCIQVRKKGYKIYEIPFKGLLHEIGKITYHRFLGIKMTVLNHSAYRKYYMQRNSIILRKKWGREETKGYFFLDFQRIVKTILYENDKGNKLKSQFKGIIDGLRYKKGA